MRGERKNPEEISVDMVGSELKKISFLIFTKCTVTFQKWKVTVHFVKKFEDEKRFWTTAGAVIFVLVSINRDEEQFYTAAGDGLTIGRIQRVRLEIFIQHSIFLKIGGHWMSI